MTTMQEAMQQARDRAAIQYQREQEERRRQWEEYGRACVAYAATIPAARCYDCYKPIRYVVRDGGEWQWSHVVSSNHAAWPRRDDIMAMPPEMQAEVAPPSRRPFTMAAWVYGGGR